MVKLTCTDLLSRFAVILISFVACAKYTNRKKWFNHKINVFLWSDFDLDVCITDVLLNVLFTLFLNVQATLIQLVFLLLYQYFFIKNSPKKVNLPAENRSIEFQSYLFSLFVNLLVSLTLVFSSRHLLLLSIVICTMAGLETGSNSWLATCFHFLP